MISLLRDPGGIDGGCSLREMSLGVNVCVVERGGGGGRLENTDLVGLSSGREQEQMTNVLNPSSIGK